MAMFGYDKDGDTECLSCSFPGDCKPPNFFRPNDMVESYSILQSGEFIHREKFQTTI